MTDAMAALPTEVDVVVLGGGAAGLFAATESATSGASTLVVERERKVGGSTGISGGYVAFCETDLQPGSKAELLEDLLEAHHFDCQDELSRRYVDLAPETYVRLRELGLEFVGTTFFAHMRKPWAHVLPTGGEGGGAQIVSVLTRAASKLGVGIVTDSRATRLIPDTSGRVEAVDVIQAGRTHRISARRGVIIATGGFTQNRALIKTFGRPGTERIWPITAPGSQGDGLLMGMALGAGVSYIGVGVAPTGPVEPTHGEGNLTFYEGGVLLNRDGDRFCDESASYLDISWAGLRQPDALMIQVYDSAIASRYRSTMLGQVLSGGAVLAADSLEGVLNEVAVGSGLDVERAIETISAYNDHARAGFEPVFGRRHLIGTSGALVRIETPPFHAAVTVPGTTHFNGGLSVDGEMRIRNVFGEIIPGLWAAGEVTGGFHGAGYLSASFLGMSLIFGRLAGVNASAEPTGD